jgi:hypothetical protein
MGSFDFQLLKIDNNNDNSTDNLKRKYEKLLKSYNKNPTQDKLSRINDIKNVLYPPPPFIREKCFPKKKIDAMTWRFVKNDNILRKQLDSRIWTSYHILSNILPSENVQIIIRMCGFTLKNYVLDIPKDIYLFAKIYYKNKEEKDKITNLYKKNKNMVNLINNLHSQKKFEKR